MTTDPLAVWNAEDWTFLPGSAVRNALAEAVAERWGHVTSGSNPVDYADAFNCPVSFMSNLRTHILYLTQTFSPVDATGAEVTGFGWRLADAPSFADHVRADNHYLQANLDIRHAKARREQIRALRWVKRDFGVRRILSANVTATVEDFANVQALWEHIQGQLAVVETVQPSSLYRASQCYPHCITFAMNAMSNGKHELLASFSLLTAIEIFPGVFPANAGLAGAVLHVETSPEGVFWDMGQGWTDGAKKDFIVGESEVIATFQRPASFASPAVYQAFSQTLATTEQHSAGFKFWPTIFQITAMWDLQSCFRYR